MSEPCTHIWDTIDGPCPWCRIAELEAAVATAERLADEWHDAFNDMRSQRDDHRQTMQDVQAALGHSRTDAVDRQTSVQNAERLRRERDKARSKAALLAHEAHTGGRLFAMRYPGDSSSKEQFQKEMAALDRRIQAALGEEAGDE